MIRIKVFLPLVFAPALLPCAMAQTPANSSPAPMPTDPAAIMTLAAQVNGLNSPDLKPWHIKATYQTFDESGQPKGTGTYEEWWAGPAKYKATYTSPGFTQTIFGTASGLFQVGDQKAPSLGEQKFIRDILYPLPTITVIENMSFDRRDVHSGDVALQCISGRPKQSPRSPLTPMYCFGKNQPDIRITASGAFQSIYNSPVLFQQHYIAQKIHITNNQKPLVDANVDLLEAQDQLSDSDLTPPSDATPILRKIMVSAGVMAGNLLEKTDPIYPAGVRVQGTVVLQARISTTGAVESLKVISGPLMLQQAATDAVKTWRYKPYLLNGDPVVVETLINVVFNLSH